MGQDGDRATPQRDAATGLVVETSSGVMLGSVSGGVRCWQGVPYAEQPIGPLRWRAPRPLDTPTVTRAAYAPGSVCWQEEMGAGRLRRSEDCLFLNIYAPVAATTPTPLPVFLFVHGGSNAVGAGSLYDPSFIVREARDVIAITVNYRLGILGFLAHPLLVDADERALNFGLQDLAAALRWVRANIEAFGGDPTNVTVMGESSGGHNVLSLMVALADEDLFHRAIIHSGAYLLDTPDRAESEVLGERFAASLDCHGATALAALRAIPPERLLAHQIDAIDERPLFHQATVDGHLLRESQLAALQGGRFARIPVMQGVNAAEGAIRAAQATDDWRNEIAPFFPGRSIDLDAVGDRYALGGIATNDAAFAAALGDGYFVCGARIANDLLARRVPVFAFEFADPAASGNGAAHATELKYFFAVDDRNGPPEVAGAISGDPAALAPSSRALAASMRQAWIDFARHGAPVRAGEWSASTEGIMVWAPGCSRLESHADFDRRHRVGFWAGQRYPSATTLGASA